MDGGARGTLAVLGTIHGKKPTLDCQARMCIGSRRRPSTFSRGRRSHSPRPCIFHHWFSIQHIQGGVKMTLPPVWSTLPAAMRSLSRAITALTVAQTSGTYWSPFSTTFIGTECAEKTMATWQCFWVTGMRTGH